MLGGAEGAGRPWRPAPPGTHLQLPQRDATGPGPTCLGRARLSGKSRGQLLNCPKGFKPLGSSRSNSRFWVAVRTPAEDLRVLCLRTDLLQVRQEVQRIRRRQTHQLRAQGGAGAVGSRTAFQSWAEGKPVPRSQPVSCWGSCRGGCVGVACHAAPGCSKPSRGNEESWGGETCCARHRGPCAAGCPAVRSCLGGTGIGVASGHRLSPRPTLEPVHLLAVRGQRLGLGSAGQFFGQSCQGCCVTVDIRGPPWGWAGLSESSRVFPRSPQHSEQVTGLPGPGVETDPTLGSGEAQPIAAGRRAALDHAMATFPRPLPPRIKGPERGVVSPAASLGEAQRGVGWEGGLDIRQP
ncbi:uncharacterized protein LOC125616802 [Marmota marmota marmota]|uniref:uncharacterized protein LOC125616802 n=1 Tax=Marmota marmota marmota TaxID=9994 RepID=UPI0020925DB5|nr:uncharacterized protein LOC125616802 [Marmota marmota marmota]